MSTTVYLKANMEVYGKIHDNILQKLGSLHAICVATTLSRENTWSVKYIQALVASDAVLF